jgi:hypothetical protein
MRTVQIGTQNFTQVVCIDEPNNVDGGGACHKYKVVTVKSPTAEVAFVDFQNGPVKEAGVNGCHNEDLLAIVIDRLEHFQKGPFGCRENALALTKLEEAMHWLNHRTAKRVARGVEGTNKL